MHAERWSHVLHENESNSERDELYDVRLRILVMVMKIRQAHDTVRKRLSFARYLSMFQHHLALAETHEAEIRVFDKSASASEKNLTVKDCVDHTAQSIDSNWETKLKNSNDKILRCWIIKILLSDVDWVQRSGKVYCFDRNLVSQSFCRHDVRNCYDPSYASMLIAMLMTMLMAMFLAIADRSSLGYRVVPKPTLFRVSLCSPESYR